MSTTHAVDPLASTEATPDAVSSRASIPSAGRRAAPIGLAVLLAAVALLVRWPLRNEISGDYRSFVSPWFDTLSSGGFSALGQSFSNYNPPYLYLLLGATALPVPKIIAIKLVSVLFDLVLALAAYLLVSLSERVRPWAPLAAAGAVLLAPTIVINSADWAQCDSIYASFALLSLYLILRRRPVWAGVLIGVAIGFKLQAVFMLPVLVLVAVHQRVAWRRALAAMLAVPLTFVVLLVPAWFAGASISQLASIYPAQVGGDGGGQGQGGGGGQGQGGGDGTGQGQGGGGQGQGGGGQGQGGGGQGQGGGGPGGGFGGGGFRGGGRSGGTGTVTGGGFGSSGSSAPYTENAANFYQWLPSDAGVFWKYAGFALTAAVILAAGVVVLRYRRVMSRASMVVLGAALLVAIPFLLPSMHERYFYLADALLIVAAFYRPRLAPFAVLAQLCSLAAYAPFLWNSTPVPLALASVGEAVVLAGAIWVTTTSIRDDERKAKAKAQDSAAVEADPATEEQVGDVAGDPHRPAAAALEL